MAWTLDSVSTQGDSRFRWTHRVAPFRKERCSDDLLVRAVGCQCAWVTLEVVAVLESGSSLLSGGSPPSVAADRVPTSGTPPRSVPASGQILDLYGSDVRYRRAPLRLRVERVRLDISGWYGGRWVWLEGHELDADWHAISWQQALVAVAAIVRASDELR